MLRRPLAPEQRMLLWRFRWSLVGEPRALTRVLRCVDWADVRDARAAAELIARWAPISIADALELLSPAFTNPEVTPPPHRKAKGAGCRSSTYCAFQSAVHRAELRQEEICSQSNPDATANALERPLPQERHLCGRETTWSHMQACS